MAAISSLFSRSPDYEELLYISNLNSPSGDFIGKQQDSAEAWHTASVVVDGGEFTHYVDGVAERSPPV